MQATHRDHAEEGRRAKASAGAPLTCGKGSAALAAGNRLSAE